MANPKAKDYTQASIEELELHLHLHHPPHDEIRRRLCTMSAKLERVGALHKKWTRVQTPSDYSFGRQCCASDLDAALADPKEGG